MIQNAIKESIKNVESINLSIKNLARKTNRKLFLFAFVTSPFIPNISHAEDVFKIEVTQSIFGAGEILTDCKFGSIHQKCKVDTGAPYSLSSKEELNTESNLINKIKYYGITGSVENCNFVETQNTSSISHLNFKSRALLICPSNEDKGLLGLNHLIETPFLLNMKDQTMTINPSSSVENLQSYISDSNDHIFIKIKIYKGKTEHEVLAMLDTGASITTANKALIKKHPELVTLLNSGGASVSDTNNAEIESQLGFINGLHISNKKIIIPYVMFTDFNALKEQTGLDVDMIIGVNVLKELNQVYIDPLNKTWGAK